MNIDCGPCTVRSWRYEDEKTLPKHANSKAIWLNMRDRFPHPYTQMDARQWLQVVVDSAVETSFAIDVGGEAVGVIGLRLHDDIERYSAEVWYWVGEQFWGRGLVTAALQAMMSYAFAQFSLTRLYAVPFAHNAVSIRVLEKVGFKREGVMRCSAIKDGVVLDQVLYAYLIKDWLLAGEA